ISDPRTIIRYIDRETSFCFDQKKNDDFLGGKYIHDMIAGIHNLDPGIYGWILVVWFPDIEIWFLGVKELGAYYMNPEFQIVPTTVQVEEGVMIGGIDIVADFANINRELPFFKSRGKP
ncbi:hypothetical protein MUP95_07395, partial [bacterium]|nr:hypothetical protein [bacterium]